MNLKWTRTSLKFLCLLSARKGGVVQMSFRVSSLVIRCQCFFNIAPIWMVVLSNGTIKGRSLDVSLFGGLSLNISSC